MAAMQDGISKLPEEIIQHILSNFLTPKEAAQCEIIVKTWLNAWQTRPVLCFIEPFFRNKSGLDKQKHKLMFRNFLNKIMQNYREHKHGIHTFKLRMNLVRVRPDELVDEWIKIASENGLKKLDLSFMSYTLPPTILETKSLEDVFLHGCRHYTGDVMCGNLRRLVLNEVYVSDEILQKIFSNCKLIENLGILRCRNWKNIQLINIDKLKTFSIFVDVLLMPSQSIEFDAPNLVSFTCESNGYYGRNSPPLLMLKIITYQNLKHLVFSRICITDDFFDDFAIKFPHIEEMRISHCHQLHNVKICGQSLRIVHLESNEKLKELEVDAAKIVRFVYAAMNIPRVVFTTASSNWESIVLLTSTMGKSWFSKLKDMLTNLIRSKIYVDISNGMFTKFNLNVIGDGPENLGPEIEKLSLEVLRIVEPAFASALLDTCFGICRPSIIELRWSDTLDFTKSFYEMLMERPETKFWGKDLKDVNVVILKRARSETEWRPEHLDWKDLLELDPCCGYDGQRAIRFTLQWCTSMQLEGFIGARSLL